MPNLSSYHPSVSRLLTLLKEDGCWFETFEHQPVLTSEGAAEIRDGYTLHQGAKAIIVRVKVTRSQRKFAMLVLPGDCRFDNSKVKRLFSARDVRFATVEEVAEVTGGILPGGVPPFGNLFDLEVIVDPELLKNEKIIFNAGDRAFSVGIKSEDYQRLVKPRIENLIS